MARKRFKPEEIVARLRQVEVLTGQGKPIVDAVRSIDVAEAPFYRWRSVESFNGKLRDELLNAEVFNTLAEARLLIEQWRMHYNTVRPHSSLAYRTKPTMR